MQSAGVSCHFQGDSHVSESNGYLHVSESPTLEQVADCEPEVISPLELLRDFETVNCAAPLVRYSKSPFRRLVSRYNVHLTHTPMIVAREFCRSAEQRNADFSYFADERGMHELVESSRGSCHADVEGHRHKRRRVVRGCLVAQFGANKGADLADAAELVSPWVDGIDLNCGCPVKGHASGSNGIGSALLRQPELVSDLIRMTRTRIRKPVSLKIRLDPDLQRTDALVRIAAHAGADCVTIHGRTRHQASTHPVNEEGLAFAADIARICGLPAVANGDIWDLEDAKRTRQTCRVSAVMAARGLLANPALFAGYQYAPVEAVSRFYGDAMDAGLPFALGHRQLAYMLESRFQKEGAFIEFYFTMDLIESLSERRLFNSLPSYASVLDTLQDMGIMG